MFRSIDTSDAEESEPADMRIARDGKTFVIGYIGDIKLHKDPAALRMLPGVIGAADKTVSVIVGGRADAQSRDLVREICGGEGRSMITRIDRRLTETEMAYSFTACDAIFLFYSISYNSSMAMEALSFKARIGCSDRPIVREMQAIVGSLWIRIFTTKGHLELALEDLDRKPTTPQQIDPLERNRLDYSFEGLAIDQAKLLGHLCR